MKNNVAVIAGQDLITFDRFKTDINSCANWITENVNRDSISFGIGVKNEYWHWALTLALLQLGKKCATVHQPKNLPDTIINHFDTWLVDEINPSLSNTLLFDPNKLIKSSNIFQGLDKLNLELNFNSKRLILTSGTTGLPKIVSISAADLRDRIKSVAPEYKNDFSAKTKLLNLIGIDTIGPFMLSLLTWMRGGTVLFGEIDKESNKFIIPYVHSNVLFTSPANLNQLVKHSDAVWPGRENRQLRVGGSRLHTSLRDEAYKLIANRVQTTYGSTELGMIATCDAKSLDNDPAAAGQVFQHVRVEVVDHNDVPLPNGQTGRIRCKSPGMALSYENDSSMEQFKNGWFYPGDVGTLSSTGWLSIAGRDSEVINLGGGKFSALDIESKLLNLSEVIDVCIVAIEQQKNTEMAIAVVTNENVDLNNLRKIISSHLTFNSNFHLLRVPNLPRNAMGKLPRHKIIENIKIILDKKKD